MRMLKSICILFCVWSIVVAVEAIKKDGFDASYLLAWPFFLGWFSYGLYKRWAIVWKLGWIILVFWFLEIAVSGLRSTLRVSGPYRWIACMGVIFGSCLFIIFWGRWWRRQRSYFDMERSGNTPRQGTGWRAPFIAWGIILILIGILFGVVGKFALVTNGQREKVVDRYHDPVLFWSTEFLLISSEGSMFIYGVYRLRR